MGDIVAKGAGLFYVIGTVLFTVYGQIVLKWRVSKYGELPAESLDKVSFILRLFIDPYIFSGLLAAIVAASLWMAAMTKLDLSYAYPFMSLSFVLVFLISVALFKEPVTAQKLLGIALIVSGVVVSGKSL